MRYFIFIFIFLMSVAVPSSAQVAVIAHKSVPVDTIQRSNLLDIYTGDVQAWSNDEPVVVFDLKPRGEVKTAFYEYLRKKSSRMKSVWLKKKLSGEWDPPESLETENEVLEKVASTEGAIGFVSLSKVTGEVKVLFIIKEREE